MPLALVEQLKTLGDSWLALIERAHGPQRPVDL